MKSLSMKKRCVMGFTLFSMFFGAGNLIFPPFLGAEAGSSTIPAMLGMILTAVVLPVLAVMSVAYPSGICSYICGVDSSSNWTIYSNSEDSIYQL